MEKKKGGFTLPGESGYEELTLKLAEKWGADVIRDSDGTVLSDDILNAGYDIYSTICIIRDHNEWASKNMDKLQQTFLCTPPVVSIDSTLEIGLMDSFFAEQFSINETEDSIAYWEVYDRTENFLVPRENWGYDSATKKVTIKNITPFNKYTVSFIAYRIWEEISMYNHTTNNWDKDHLMQIDPMYPETRDYLLSWLENWCITHPDTDVVRFTSMFYNFVWVWGSNEKNRHLFADWGSYDYTVSVQGLNDFEQEYGYRLHAEDFINKGNFNVTHMPPTHKQKDYMEFINNFVISFGKKLIDVVHKYNKKAYVFYDDSWVGIEPYNGRFKEFGFDGLIKCVFSGYEARLCADVDVPVHELRLHPYLFPVGLGGAPTFSEDGDPTLEAKKFWNSVRRALLKAPIQRIGLGGYLHLVENYPDFCDYIEQVADEFRLIQTFHELGKPYVEKSKVAVLHAWGKLRSWTLSGHFHETFMHDLIHINEALSGLPFEVSFISFDDVKKGKLKDFDVVINAGYATSAWSGGDEWLDNNVVRALTEWVYNGGAFIGVNEPSAITGFDSYFRMSHVLGLDEDTGAKVCHGKFKFDVQTEPSLHLQKVKLKEKSNRFLTTADTKVLLANDTNPILTVNNFGKGKGIYLSEFEFNLENTKFLHELINYSSSHDNTNLYITDNFNTECTYFPESKKLVVINNSDSKQKTSINTEFGVQTLEIDAYSTEFINL